MAVVDNPVREKTGGKMSIEGPENKVRTARGELNT